MKLEIHNCSIYDCASSWCWETAKEGFADYDIWAVFRGRGKLQAIRTQTLELNVSEGKIFLLDPHAQYIGSHDPDNPLQVITCHFHVLNEEGVPVFPWGLMAKRMTDIPFMKTLLTKVVTLYNSNHLEEANCFLSAVMTELLMMKDINEPVSDIWAKLVQEMVFRIDSQTKPPSLAAFAKEFGYCSRYVGKMFAHYHGIRYSDYVQNVRISRAKSLLLNTALSLEQIAEQTGFYNASHFSKSFQNSVGMLPKDYRKL